MKPHYKNDFDFFFVPDNVWMYMMRSVKQNIQQNV